jgi:hypothetical protein
VIEKPFLSAELLGRLPKRGTKRQACMRRRFVRKVFSPVRGLAAIVTKDRITLSHSLGGAKSGDLDFPDWTMGVERQIAR